MAYDPNHELLQEAIGDRAAAQRYRELAVTWPERAEEWLQRAADCEELFKLKIAQRSKLYGRSKSAGGAKS